MSKAAFTLIELIVVIAIIAILAAIIAPNAFKAVEKAKVSKAIADFKAIKSATYALYSDTGMWPHGGNSQIRVGTSALTRNPSTNPFGGTRDFTNWDGPYLENFLGMHPWAGTYMLTSNDPQFGNSARGDLSVEFEDLCFSGGTSNCRVPETAAVRIDMTVDDNNTLTGSFRRASSWPDVHWVLIEDICPTTAYCW